MTHPSDQGAASTLLQTAITQTLSGKLQWRPIPGAAEDEHDTLLTETPNYLIRLRYHRRTTGHILLKITGRDNRPISVLNSADLDPIQLPHLQSLWQVGAAQQHPEHPLSAVTAELLKL